MSFLASGKRRVIGAVIAAFLLLPPLLGELSAAVKVERPSLKLGATSMRVPRYSWCEFSCLVENSDAKARQVQVRVVSAEGQQTNVFTGVVDVPARSSVLYRAPVLVENAEKYHLESFVDGRKLPVPRSESEMNLKITTSKTAQFAVLDDGDASLGSFNQLPSFKDKMNVTTFSSSSAPDSVLQLRDAQALFVSKPDFSKLGARQVRAIKEYVAQGGTLIFANPEGALAAAKSPLAELLPCSPLRIRTIDSLPVLSKMAPSFKGFDGRPVEFLECSTDGDGMSAFSEGAFPLLRVKAYGLGLVKLLAIAPSDDNFKNCHQAWEELLGTLLSGQRPLPDFSPFSAALDQMTGFKIPGLGTVRLILAVYLLLLLAIVVAGFLMKRGALAWALAAVFSLIATFAILQAAKASSKKGRLATAIEFEVAKKGAASATTFVAFFSDGSFKLDAVGASPESAISGMMPNLNSFLPPGMAMGFAQGDERKLGSGGKRKFSNPLQFARPLDIRREPSGAPSLKTVNVDANSSRQFTLYESWLPGIDAGAAPELSFGPKGAELKPWTPPAALKFDAAFLILPNGSVPLERDGSSWRLVSGQSLFQSDMVLKNLREALESGFSKQLPYLALIGEGDGAASALKLDEKASRQGRRVLALPVKTSCQDGTLAIPAEAMALSSGDTTSRMIMDGNRLKQGAEVQGPAAYAFRLALPSFLPPGTKISELSVKFAYSSGGNIKATVNLLGRQPPPPPVKPGGKPGKAPPRPVLKGLEREPGVFVFDAAKLKEAVEDDGSSALVQIDGVERDPDMSETLKMRADRWSPLSLSVSAKCVMPEGVAPFSL